MTLPIRPLPTPPTRRDPTSFYDRADNFVAALPAMTEDVNEAITAVNTAVGKAKGSADASAASAAAAAESARQADAGILEILRRMPNAEAILAELAKHKTVAPPITAPANGVDGDLVRDNNFAAPPWSYNDCTVHDLGGGQWGLRADNKPGGNPFITRTIDGLVYGQWYTASVDVQFDAEVAGSVVLWARRSDGFTMVHASLGPGDGWRTLSVSFRMAATDGKLILIVNPGAMAQGKDLVLSRVRVARGGVYTTPFTHDNRLGYPIVSGVTRAYVNYAELGRHPAPDGTPTAIRVGQQQPGQNAYIELTAPNAAHDKVPLTFSVWVKPLVDCDYQLRLTFGNHQLCAEGPLLTPPVNQWSRLSVRGDFAGAPDATVRMYIDHTKNDLPGGYNEFLLWGEVLEPSGSFTPFASLPVQTTRNLAVGGHAVIDGPGALAIFGPAQAVRGDVLWITVANGRNDHVFWGGGLPVMGRNETLRLDMGDSTYRFVYIDDQRGWWIA